MNKIKFISLTASIVLALAFTLSCDSGGGGGGGGNGNGGGGAGTYTGTANGVTYTLQIADGTGRAAAAPRVAAAASDMTWTPVTDNTFDGGFTAIAFGNGRFVAGGRAPIAYSSDGVSWTPATTDNANATLGINAIAFGNNRFVAGGSQGKILYSSDGISWSDGPDRILGEYTAGTGTTYGNHINAIAYGNNKFVAVGDDGKMAYSSDGVSWTPVADTKFIDEKDGDGYHIYAIAFGNNRFVAGSFLSKMAYSSDGINWTAIKSNPLDNNIHAIAYGNNRFVAVDWDGKVAYSSDGVSWTKVKNSLFPNEYVDINAIAWGGNRFVAGGDEDGKIAYSSDGINWTAGTISSFGTVGIDVIAYGNGTFVASGYGSYQGRIAYSTDDGPVDGNPGTDPGGNNPGGNSAGTYTLTTDGNTSTGTVISFNDVVFTLQPSAGGATFTVTVSGTSITAMSGTITWDGGTASIAPDTFTPSGGNNPNPGGGSWPPANILAKYDISGLSQPPNTTVQIWQEVNASVVQQLNIYLNANDNTYSYLNNWFTSNGWSLVQTLNIDGTTIYQWQKGEALNAMFNYDPSGLTTLGINYYQ